MSTRLIWFINLFTSILVWPVLADESLFDAVRNDDVAKLEALIAGGADVKAKDSDGNAPLHWAAQDDSKKVAEVLIAHGADVEALDSMNFTPLHRAAEFGSKGVAEILIARHATVDAKNDWQTTPLHLAAWIGFNSDEKVKEVIALLLANKADLEAKNINGATPFLLAANPLLGTEREGRAMFFLERGAKWNIQNNDGDAPIHAAARLNQPKLLKVLLDRGADVNLKGQYGETPLFGQDETRETVEMLIAHGANVNLRDANGLTPLLLAARGTNGAVQSLIQHGADVKARSNDGESALHEAAFSSDSATVAFLTGQGADVNARDNHGATPMHFAAASAMDSATDAKIKIATLVKNGADVNAKDSDGNTPLHWADSEEMANALIVNGADVKAKNNAGQTPEEYRKQLQDSPDDLSFAQKTSGQSALSTAVRGRQRLMNLLQSSRLHQPAQQKKAAKAKALKNDLARQNSMAAQAVASALHQRQWTRNLMKGYKAQLTSGQKKTAPAPVSKNARGKARALDYQFDIFDAVLDDDVTGVRDFIAAGWDVNIQDCGGATPLHYAARYDYRDVAEVLLDKGARVNASDDDGNTPLHYAWGHGSMVDFLISHGANPNALNDWGETPAQYWQYKDDYDEGSYSKKALNQLTAVPLQDRHWMASLLKHANTRQASANQNPTATSAGTQANSGSLPGQEQKTSKPAAAAEKKAKIQSLVRTKGDDSQLISLWQVVFTDNHVEQIEVLEKTKDGQLADIRYGMHRDTNAVILEKHTVSLNDVKSVTLNSYPDGQQMVKVYTKKNAVACIKIVDETLGDQFITNSTTDFQMNFPAETVADENGKEVLSKINALLEQQKRLKPQSSGR